MDATWIGAVALVVGIALGAAVVRFLDVASRRGHRVMALASEGIPDGVGDVVEALESVGVVLDASNAVVRASPGAMTLGIVQGRDLASDELRDLVEEARVDAAPVSRDLDFRRGRFQDAQTLWLHARAAPLGSRYMLLLADDHTEERRLEGVRRDFVANVSHELKTPIGAIALLADAIDAAAEDPERVRAFTDRLQAESTRLGRMAKELIDLSRVQADDPLESPARVDVETIVERSVEAVRVAADAKRIRISTRVADRATVLGDESLLLMALTNLLSNAVQYSPEGVHVGVGARVTADLVEISVTDKGVGIAPEDVPRVFERFYRVDPARSRVTGGTGLGLSITKHIAVAHGGEVTLWSRLGQGSTFTLRLPLAQPEAEELPA